jgi:hypothetical protein
MTPEGARAAAEALERYPTLAGLFGGPHGEQPVGA